MIYLSTTHLHEIQQHSVTDYPHECCGAMLGKCDAATHQKITQKLVTIPNHSTENKRRRFSISADDYQRLERIADDEGVTLLGFYHSHPDHPAIPSETDRRFAWPFFSYIIQSIYNRLPTRIASYELDTGINQFKDEKLIIGDDK